MASGNLNEGKAARWMSATIEPINKQIKKAKVHVVIAYNHRHETELLGSEEHFAPICVQEHSYLNDSYDPKSEKLKYVWPRECESCR